MGIVSSLALIMLSPDLFKLYGLAPTSAPIPFSNPGIISIPLSFITLVVVSLMTQPKPVPATT
jgi:cation/acetate symporter